MRAEEVFERLKGVLEEKNLDLFIISKIENVRYLTGFTGSSGFVLITRERAIFLTDPRYTHQAEKECVGWDVCELKGEKLSSWIRREIAPSVVGVEEWITVGALERMREELERVSFEVIFGAVESMREVKEDWEIERVRRALSIAESTFEEILSVIKPGVVERDLALEIEFRMRGKGADAVSFPIIVASGKRSALPHGVASTKSIEAGDVIVIDFGCVVEGYCSDITRVVKLGRFDEEERRVFEVVKSAHLAAVELIGNGERDCRKIHKEAERVIDGAGYSGLFGHGLGHGVGLEIHEKPSLSPLSEDRLKEGSIFTIEPGIYIPNRFGMRLENMYLLGGQGARCLNSLPLSPVEL